MLLSLMRSVSKDEFKGADTQKKELEPLLEQLQEF
jgi:hypothetical protein